MEAGRELDTAIAEKLFGLRVEITQEETSGYVPDARWVSGSEYYEHDVYWAIPPARYADWQNGEDDGDGEWYLALYSTEIAWAFDAVERMAERGLRLSLDRWGGEPWWAEFSDEKWEHGGQETGTTAAHAICLAALKALDDLAHSTDRPHPAPKA